MQKAMKRKGFTLVEVLLASIIGLFIATMAIGALKAISTSAEMIDKGIEESGEVRFAAKMIAGDLMNLYRDTEAENMEFFGTIEETGDGPVSRLTFYTVGRVKARAPQPEGDVYEVEYSLVKTEEKSVLFRRLWPNPNKQSEPGGVLSVIAEDIELFEVSYFDGEQWQMEWPIESRGLPAMVRVNIASGQTEQQKGAAESFAVNFPRLGTRSSQADSSSENEGAEESSSEGNSENSTMNSGGSR